MKKRVSLTIVDQISVKEPCQESWDGMAGDASRRYCDRCSHTVTNLSTLTKKRADQVVRAANAKKLCVRFERNIDGSIHFQPTWIERSRAQFGRALALFAACFSFLNLQSVARAEDAPPAPTQIPALLGQMAIMPTPTPSATPQHATRPLPGVMGEIAASAQSVEKLPAIREEMGDVAASE